MLEIRKLFNILRDIVSEDHIVYTVAALITGLVAVGYAQLFHFAEKISQAIFHANPYYMLAVSPVCFVASAWLVIRHAPGAAGSGIPQVMAAVQDVDPKKKSPLVEKYFSLRVLIIKIVSSAICVLGGGAIGREGPTIQIGAGIFDLVARKFYLLKSRISEKYWIVTGGASGLAAAFNTPLGGLVYAIEELATPEFNKFKSYLIAAVIIAGFSAQSITGRYLYVGYPVLGDVTWQLIPITVLLGITTGVAGALFAEWTRRLTAKIASQKVPKRLGIAAAVGVVLALSAIFITEYSFGSGREAFQDILFGADANASISVVFVRFVGPIITFASGVAGGIFAPSLAAGGAIGGFLGHFIGDVNQSMLVILGMIGFLAGVTRAPFTSFILVFEMTDRHSALFLMMLIALVATTVAKVISPTSFYSQIAAQMLENKNKDVKRTEPEIT